MMKSLSEKVNSQTHKSFRDFTKSLYTQSYCNIYECYSWTVRVMKRIVLRGERIQQDVVKAHSLTKQSQHLLISVKITYGSLLTFYRPQNIKLVRAMRQLKVELMSSNFKLVVSSTCLHFH